MGHTTSGSYNLLERQVSRSHGPLLHASQTALDQMLSKVQSQASDPYLFTSFFAGQSFVRGLDFLASPLFLSSNGILGSRIGLGAYKNFRIFGEAATFELVHRGLQVKLKGANPELLNWEGETGLRNGLLHSNLNFFAIHGFGKLAGNSNLVFQHTLQSTGMVSANQLAGLLKMAPASQESLSAQLVEAALFNLQQQAMTQLSPVKNISAFERLHINVPVASTKPFFPPHVLHHIQMNSAPRSSVIGKIPQNKVLVLGDIHGKWHVVQKILDYEFPEGNGTALAVGDLQIYPALRNGHKIYFIPGNHENFRQVENIYKNGDATFHPLLAGDTLQLGTLTLTGIPGVYSPHFFTNPTEAPLKYFTPDRLEAVKRTGRTIDILLMHDAPSGIGLKKADKDLGDPLLRGLIEALQPGIVFFGHHHLSFNAKVGDVPIAGLDQPHRSYTVLRLDSPSRWELSRVLAELKKEPGQTEYYQYGWERDRLYKTEHLFSGVKRMSTLSEIESMLNTNHRKNVIDELSQLLLSQEHSSSAEIASQCRIRAGLAANEVLPYVARYLDLIQRNPNLPADSKAEALGKIYDEMSANKAALATGEYVQAFRLYLKRLQIP